MENPLIENVRLSVRKSDKIYEVRWIEDGEPRRKSTGTRVKAEAKTKFTQIEADIRAERIPDVPTIGWIADAYLASKKKHAKTEQSYKVLCASLHFVKKRLGDLLWNQLTQDHIDDYAAARLKDNPWANHPRKRTDSTRTVGPSTVDKDLRILRAALAHTKVSKEVEFKINVTPSPSKDVWLTKSEVKLLLDACEPKRAYGENGRVTYRRRAREHLYTFILISVASAARKEAVLELTWDQIKFPDDADLHGKKLVDLQTLEVAGNTYIDFGKGNGNKRRPKMPVGDNFRLMWQLVTSKPSPLTADDHQVDQTENRVITHNGKPIKDIKKGWQPWLRSVGLKRMLHRTRSSTAA